MLSLPPSTPSEHSSPRIPDFAEVHAEEWQSFGVGDGGTTVFVGNIRGPIVPGSVVIYGGLSSAIDQLGALKGVPAGDDAGPAVHDILEDGNLYGHTTSSTVDYSTGQVMVTWSWAPLLDQPLYVRWLRRRHRLRGSQVQVRRPDGETEWVDMKTFADIARLED